MARSYSKSQLRAAIDTVRVSDLQIYAIEFPPDSKLNLVLGAAGSDEGGNEWNVARGIEPAVRWLGREQACY